LKTYGYQLTHQIGFNNFISISEEHFLKNVDTGDILLFRTDSRNVLGSWITRTFTNSHFDHVAVLLRFGDSVKDLYLFEAVGEKGVRLASWVNTRTELYHGGFFEKIITRKLLLEMTSEKLNELDSFRRKSTGLSYGIQTSKLIFNQRSEPRLSSQKQHDVEPNRTFFCSELIAKAFKVLEIIRNPYEKSSGSFVPGSFAKDETIDKDMVSGVALGPMLNILVNTDNILEKDSILHNQRTYKYVN
jgi:hypothetical protein